MNNDTERPSEQENPAGLDALLPFDEHEEEVSVDGKKVRHRGVYLLPNLFTTGALFAGFYAIVSAMQGSFESAAIAIFIAMILDGLDGRVARLTNTSSVFGEQYDSLSDMVSFGLAPALVVFSWSLQDLGKLGWAAAFIYAACAALRLARFNAQIGVVDKKHFVGLASPAAAAIITGIVWVWSSADPYSWVGYPIALVTALVGLLMVSNIRYSSFKGIDFRGRVPFVGMLAVVFIFALLMIDAARVLLLMSVAYGLSGPVMAIFAKRKNIFKEKGEDSL